MKTKVIVGPGRLFLSVAPFQVGRMSVEDYRRASTIAVYRRMTTFVWTNAEAR